MNSDERKTRISVMIDIIQQLVGEISTKEEDCKESLYKLKEYEFICNSILEILVDNIKYRKSTYRSENAIGTDSYIYLKELRDWINEALEEG